MSASARGRGLGKKLCGAAEAQARAWGFGEMLLLVEAGNAPAKALYQSLGYSVVPPPSLPSTPSCAVLCLLRVRSGGVEGGGGRWCRRRT